MDAKDLRTESTIDARSHDGSNKYSQNATAITCNRNKSYHDIGSNSLGKVDVPSSRPCAVIGPDRVVPPPATADSKKPPEQWLCNDTMYRRPPDYPIKMTDFQNTARNISPRQTFQENMQRIMVPPTYSSVKMSNDSNLSADGNSVLMPKNNKMNVPAETKYCDVPYNISPLPVEQKSFRDVNVPSVNSAINQSSPYGWSTTSTVRPSRPYGAPELYQYADYPGYASARTIPVGRPLRNYHEETTGFPERFYPDTNMRFKPYPQVKEGYPQPRYECINNYSNSYHPPPYPPPRYDIQKSHNPHLYSAYSQVPVKYFDSRMGDSVIDGFQRSNPQPNYNVSYPNQFIHPAYAPISGNCLQNKLLPYSQEMTVKNNPLNKLAYENKLYADYENMRNKSFPVPENYYSPKGQIMVSKTHTSNLQPTPGHPYLKKEYPTFRNYDPNKYPDMTSNMGNPMLRFPSQFSPNIAALSDHITGNESNQALGILLEDSYGHHSSVTNMRNTDPNLNRLHSDLYGRYDYKFNPMRRPSNRAEANNSSIASSKEKKNIDVRQFLQQWNEDDDNNDGNNGNQGTQNSSEKKLNADQEQLYVLGLVHVPNEELGKYDHIQKISKLPDNIKGYNSLELLNQFEEAIESSKLNTSSKTREFQGNFRAMPVQRATVPPLQRPISPLDVEAKISQSVIHKEVGCNFEIKPCSPKMLNVEIAAPIQTVLNERAIEKLSNPLIPESPHESEGSESLVCKSKEEDRNKIVNCNSSSCKMDQKQFAEQKYTPNKSDFINDIESNSGICLASLPRLDNEIELNFPEVNQQFINANSKSDTVITTLPEIQCGSTEAGSDKPLDHTKDENPKDIDNPEQLSLQMEPTQKLCKFRKLKKEDFEYSSDGKAAQAARTDSVIIKNPDTSKEHECGENTSPLLTSTESQINVNDKEFPIHDLLDVEAKDPNIALDFSVNKYEYSFGNNVSGNVEDDIFSNAQELSPSTYKNKEFNPSLDNSPINPNPEETEVETASKINESTFQEESSDLGPDQINITRNLSVNVKLPSDSDSDAGSSDDSKSILFEKSKNTLSLEKANEEMEFCDVHIPVQDIKVSYNERDIKKTQEDQTNVSDSPEKIKNKDDLENKYTKISTETAIEDVSEHMLNGISTIKNTHYQEIQNNLNNENKTHDNIITDQAAFMEPNIVQTCSEPVKCSLYCLTDDDKNVNSEAFSETIIVKQVLEKKGLKVKDSLQPKDNFGKDLLESDNETCDQLTCSNKKDFQDLESDKPSTTYDKIIPEFPKNNCNSSNFENCEDEEKDSNNTGCSVSEDIKYTKSCNYSLHDQINHNNLCSADPKISEQCSESKICKIQDVETICSQKQVLNHDLLIENEPNAIQVYTKLTENLEKEDTIEISHFQTRKSYHLSEHKDDSPQRLLEKQEKDDGSNRIVPEVNLCDLHFTASKIKLISPKEDNIRTAIYSSSLSDVSFHDLEKKVNCLEPECHDHSARTCDKHLESMATSDIFEHIPRSNTHKNADSTNVSYLTSGAVQNLSEKVDLNGSCCFDVSGEQSCGNNNVPEPNMDQNSIEGNMFSQTDLPNTNQMVIHHEQSIQPGDNVHLGRTTEKSSAVYSQVDSMNISEKKIQANNIQEQNFITEETPIKHSKRVDNISLITGICFTTLSLDLGLNSKEQISEFDDDDKRSLKEELNPPISKHDFIKCKKPDKKDSIFEDTEDDTLNMGKKIKSDSRNSPKEITDIYLNFSSENQLAFALESKIETTSDENQYSTIQSSDLKDEKKTEILKIYTDSNDFTLNTIPSEILTENNDIRFKQCLKVNSENISSYPTVDCCNNKIYSNNHKNIESNDIFINMNRVNRFNVRLFSPFIRKLLMFEEGKLSNKQNIEFRNVPKEDIKFDIETSNKISLHNTSNETPVTKSPQFEVYENASVFSRIKNYTVTRLKDIVTIFLRDHYPNVDLDALPFNYNTTCSTPFNTAPLSQFECKAQEEKKLSVSNYRNKRCNQIHPKKRSLSESDLSKFEESAVDIKRIKINDKSDLQTEVIAGNIFLHNRRNTVSTFINDENLYILIDDNCIITEDSDNVERNSTTEETECFEFGGNELDFDEDDCFTNVATLAAESQYSYSEYVQNFEENLDEAGPWIEDVACVETVVSDNVAEDIEITSDFSPKNDSVSDFDSNGEDVFPLNSDYNNTDKVKHIYKGCHDDERLVETLYRTPQMNVNKTLVIKGNPDILEINQVDKEREDLESMLSESMNTARTMYSDVTSIARDSLIAARSLASRDNNLSKQMFINEENHLACPKRKANKIEDSLGGGTTQFGTTYSCESSSDNVFAYNEFKDENSKFSSSSSSPEVSSTTSEEKCSSILLKITSYNGSIVSEISNNREIKRMCCKYTEKSEYNAATNSANRPLITKAAQKYIPPINESINDLKVKLPLPQDSLVKLQQLKKSKDLLKVERNVSNRSLPLRPDILKKHKPKFEDVLKSIDDIQFQMHKEKNKKVKKYIPKVVIKKNENGSHYTSSTSKKSLDPDLTGRKWQPWVFIERNVFIDKMAMRKRTEAVYSHRKKEYVFKERLQKYKSVSSTKFVITQPNLDDKGHLKYTIKLKHNY